MENLQFLWEPIGKQLQTLIRVQAGGALLEVDTVDLGKQAKRQDFAARIAKATGVSVDAIDGELLRVADERGTPEPQAAAEPLTDDLAARTKAALDATDPAVVAEAEAMLASPALIKEIGSDLDGIGVAGDLPPLNEATSGARILGGRNQGRARNATRKSGASGGHHPEAPRGRSRVE